MNCVSVFGISVAFSLVLAMPLSAGSVVTFFPVSVYNSNTPSMDATLGITGFQIDGFESTTLIAGVTLSMSGDAVANPTTISSLANLYNVGSQGVTSGDNWDGPNVLVNNPTNQVTSASSTDAAKLITFNLPSGVTAFGIGLSNFQSPDSPSFPITDHDLFVNGVDVGSVESLAGANWTPGLGRNAYLLITGTDGTPITSVGFENDSAADILLFDHLAINEIASSVPEPRTSYLLILGASGYFLYRCARPLKRRKRAKEAEIASVASLSCQK